MTNTENVHEGCISRTALIEKVRELTIDGPNIVPYVETHDLLTHLRGEGLCIFHKDKNCCAYDVKQRSGTQTNYVDSRTPDEKVNEPDSVVTTAQSFQEETECCEKCRSYKVNPDGIGRPHCCDEGCPCHKPRTEHPNEVMVIEGKDLKVTFAPRTEECVDMDCICLAHRILPRTEEHEHKSGSSFGCRICKPNLQETEKEGASFSGREEKCTHCGRPNPGLCRRMYGEAGVSLPAQENNLIDWSKYLVCEQHPDQPFEHTIDGELCIGPGMPRPKETTTPQSREQGGEKIECTICGKSTKNIVAHVRNKHLEGMRGQFKPEKTNQ